MPDQAFSKISTLAGPEIPARHQTLNYILKTLMDAPSAPVSGLIESDPMVLTHFLQLGSGCELLDWQSGISPKDLFDQVLTLANDQGGNAGHGKAWQRSFLAGELARVLSQQAGFSEPEQNRCRLLALLLAVGHETLAADSAFQLPRSEQVERETQEYGLNGAELGAKLLQRMGLPNRDSDVLTYQYEDLSVLEEAGTDLVLVAMAGRLSDAILTDFELAEHYFELIDRRLGVNSQVLRELLGTAYQSFRAQNDLLLDCGDVAGCLARANLASQLNGCQSEQALNMFANKLFSAHGLAFAWSDGDQLVAQIEEETFTISHESKSSAIQNVFKTQTPFSAEEDALVAVVDKQIQSRLAANALWLLPLEGAGVAILAIEKQTTSMMDAFLCDAFAAACIRTFNEPETGEVIELDLVQNRVRELTHEVNNPLAIVQNYLKMLSLKLDNDSPVQGDIDTISKEMLRIGSIIQQYADIGASTSEDQRPVDVNALVKAHASLLRTPDVQIETHLDPNMPTITTSENALKQVLVNLLKNALEALADTPTAHIQLSTNSQINFGGQHYVEIIIEDNGPGIPEHVYQNLFAADNSSKGAGHSGIGLSVAHQLITHLGGHVSCRTSAVSGTLFQILLPAVEQKGKP